MCFSFLKSKPRKPPTSPSPSTSHPTTNTTSNNTFSSSKSSSISSHTSLSSLKHSLPQTPQIFSLADLRSATNNFLLRPISTSSSSTTWKTTLHGKTSAVTHRRLRRPLSTSHLLHLLSLLSKSHHSNLTKLFGASVNAANHIYLVYEYIPGVNLNDCLRNPKNPNFTVLSNWLSRVQIAAGIADGLDYLHNLGGGKYGIIHNHIKSSSIIVSDEGALTAKICHFGAAQICGEVKELFDVEIEEINSGQPGLKRVEKFEGARGYMSPEFQNTGVPSLKSDIFAFGVVLLEILSGEEPVKIRVGPEKGVFRKVSLIETAREAVGGRLRQWMDRRLRDSYPIEVAEGLIRVGLECVHDEPEKRPDMGRVAGWISKLYLDSTDWAQSFGVPDEITVSFAPR